MDSLPAKQEKSVLLGLATAGLAGVVLAEPEQGLRVHAPRLRRGLLKRVCEVISTGNKI